MIELTIRHVETVWFCVVSNSAPINLARVSRRKIEKGHGGESLFFGRNIDPSVLVAAFTRRYLDVLHVSSTVVKYLCPDGAVFAVILVVMCTRICQGAV